MILHRAVLLLVVFAAGPLGCGRDAADSPPAVAVPEAHLSLVAFGDWGSGSADQKQVAESIASLAEHLEPPLDGMLLLGDNFYMDLAEGADSPEWQTVFEQVYDRRRLPFPFYVALGNHDYDTAAKAQAELDYARWHPDSRWKLPARWYRLELPAGKPLVTLLMLDSNYRDMPKLQWMEELDWLKDELAKPRTTPWLVCCAHHPLFNNGPHGDDGPLTKDWGPLFQQYHVNLYLTGHDHDLQHLEVAGWDTSFVISGGGGDALYKVANSGTRFKFGASTHGFTLLRFTPEALLVTLCDASGNRLHQFVKKPGTTNSHAAGASESSSKN